MSAKHKSVALETRQALWTLQKEILNFLKEDFDRENGYQSSPTEWFQTLMGSERYSWLRELTSLMADIDIMTELEDVTETHASTARFEIERLLFEHTPESSHFAKQYRVILTAGGTLQPLHSQLKSHVQKLPAASLHKEQALAERKTWHEEHRHQSRRKRN